MTRLALLALAGLLGVGVVAWFTSLERAGRQVVVVTLILGLLVVEGSLYPGFDAPAGLFHPTLGATSFRPYEVIIVLALVARVLTQGWPERIGTTMLAWFALFAWIGCQAASGILAGHAADLVTFEAKVVVYLGAMALAAGVPAARYVEGREFRRLIFFAAAAAATMIVLDATGVRIAGGVPGIPVEEFGRLGSDAASIFLALGTVAVALSLTSEGRRVSLLLAAAPLLAAPFVPYQRAVLLSVAVLVLAVAVLLLGRRLWRRVRVTPAELALGGLVVVFLMTLPAVINAWRPAAATAVPFADRVEEAFTSPAKLQSAEDRVNQYKEAWPLISEKPVFGWGLGKTYTHYQPGLEQFVTDNYTHNIAGDLLLRTGVVGLLLFSVAIALSLGEGLVAWRRHGDGRVACLAMAAVVVVLGLLAKGGVESIFEKFRLAVLLGLFLGAIHSARLSASPTAGDRRAPEGAASSRPVAVRA